MAKDNVTDDLYDRRDRKAVDDGECMKAKDKEASGDVPVVEIKYGLFINTVIDFVIVAFVIFMVIKQMNRLKKPDIAAVPTTKGCPPLSDERSP
jgi:large conductance mechanosensitive channel protein